VPAASRCCQPAEWWLRRWPAGAVRSEWLAVRASVSRVQHPAPACPFQGAGPSASPVQSAVQTSGVSAKTSGLASSDVPGAARRREAAWLSGSFAVEATSAKLEEAARSGAKAWPPGAAVLAGLLAQQQVAAEVVPAGSAAEREAAAHSAFGEAAVRQRAAAWVAAAELRQAAALAGAVAAVPRRAVSAERAEPQPAVLPSRAAASTCPPARRPAPARSARFAPATARLRIASL
jgi:hypothetical protein